MGCGNYDFSSNSPWKLFFVCMRTSGKYVSLMSINQVGISTFHSAMGSLSAVWLILKKRERCLWVHPHWLQIGIWGDLRPEGMNALGPYSGHTFWKLDILDSQGWFRPDYLCLPAGVKLIPTWIPEKAFIVYFHRLVSTTAWTIRLDWNLLRFLAAQILL